MNRWIVLASLAWIGCSSDNQTAPSTGTDAASETPAADAAPDAMPVEEAATCTLSGACFDEFLAKQKKAASCFGHFGLECGTLNGAMTECKWDDGAALEMLDEDAGGKTVVYKSKTGDECFRRLSTGDLIFPDGSTFTTTIAGPSNPKLTVGCKTGTPFTCDSEQCSNCGIELRVCCH